MQCMPRAGTDTALLLLLPCRTRLPPISLHASSFSSNTSTCQLWSQRSIGAVARKDLAKFAAMQHMAQQHSCNSPTQASLLAAGHHVMGLGSTWSAAHSVHSSSSLASLALTAAGGSSIFQEGSRRGSSPSGQQLQGHHSLPCTGRHGCPVMLAHAAGAMELQLRCLLQGGSRLLSDPSVQERHIHIGLQCFLQRSNNMCTQCKTMPFHAQVQFTPPGAPSMQRPQQALKLAEALDPHCSNSSRASSRRSSRAVAALTAAAMVVCRALPGQLRVQTT